MRRSGRVDRAPASLAGALALVILAASPRGAAGQSLFEKLGLDRLHLGAIGVAYGPAQPRNVRATRSYSIQADYGAVAPHWRVLFGLSYWGSRYTDAAVNGFVEQLRQSVQDPSGDDTIVPDKVRVSDLALEADLRWEPTSTSSFVRPFLGGGLGVHYVSVESKLIEDTFIESALDDIGLGATVLAGVELAPARRVSVGIEARYTFIPNVRYGTVRATATYHFSLDQPSRSP